MKKLIFTTIFFLAFCISASAGHAVGDIDGDWEYTKEDIIGIAKLLVAKNVSDEKLFNADITKDGILDMSDIKRVRRNMQSNLEPSFCSVKNVKYNGCVWNFVTVGEYSQINYNASEYNMRVRFNILVPKGYSPDKKYALAVHLHGLGGENNATANLSGGTYFKNIEKSEYGDNTILLLPQCPVGMTWPDDRDTIEAAYCLIEYLCEHMSIDKNRIYLSGHSNGSKGVAYMIMNHPNTFAAAVMGSGASSLKYYTNIDNIATTPIWLFCGSKDPVPDFLGNVRVLYAKLKSRGADVKYTEYEGLEHNIFNVVGNTEGLVDWVFSKTLEK